MRLESNLTSEREQACAAIREAMWSHLVQQMNTGQKRVDMCAAELIDYINQCKADLTPEKYGMQILSGFQK